MDTFGISITNTTHSAFIDSQFVRCIGNVSSTISLYDSHLDLLANTFAEYVNFEQNIGGSTIFAQASEMLLNNIFMH